MKTAKLFLVGMYLHLILSIAVPSVSLYSSVDGGWSTLGVGIFLFYLLMILVIQVVGWVCVAAAVKAYRRDQTTLLRRIWKLLKLYSIPFYILNFIYSCLAWFVLIGASRGIMAFLLPIPILITHLMVLQSGFVGICFIMYLRKQPENEGNLSGLHYLLRLIPVADVISTIILLGRYPINMGDQISINFKGGA